MISAITLAVLMTPPTRFAGTFMGGSGSTHSLIVRLHQHDALVDGALHIYRGKIPEGAPHCGSDAKHAELRSKGEAR